MKRRPLAPRGGNDDVQTPPELAERIVKHFKPKGYILEPCSGDGNFFRALCDHCPYESVIFQREIKIGLDFFDLPAFDANDATFLPFDCDWIITNPPWSQFRRFLQHSMKLADNVVFLSLVNAWFMKARVADVREAGFGMREILFVDTPGKPWPQTGFQLGAVWVQRGYEGSVRVGWST